MLLGVFLHIGLALDAVFEWHGHILYHVAMDDKYKQHYEYKKEQMKKKTPKQFGDHRDTWDPNDPVPYMPKEWARKEKYKEALNKKEKGYVWTLELQALEDMLWAS